MNSNNMFPLKLQGQVISYFASANEESFACKISALKLWKLGDVIIQEND